MVKLRPMSKEDADKLQRWRSGQQAFADALERAKRRHSGQDPTLAELPKPVDRLEIRPYTGQKVEILKVKPAKGKARKEDEE